MDLNNLAKSAMNAMGLGDDNNPVTDLENASKKVTTDASGMVNGATGSVSADVSNAMGNIASSVGGSVTDAKNEVNDMFGNVAGDANGMMGDMMNKATEAMSGVGSTVDGAMGDAKSKLESGKNFVDEMVGNAVDKGFEAADKVTGGMASTVGGLTDVKNIVSNKVKEIIPDELENAASTLLGKK